MPLRPSRISIASYSFAKLISSGSMNVFGYLESCRFRYHLHAADIWNGLLGQDVEVYVQDDFLRSVKDGLGERDLELANYHADGCHLWEDDRDHRERNDQLARRHIHAAEMLGAKTVRIDTGGRDRHWTSEQFDYIVNKYRDFARRAGEHGYRIGPETHWGTELFPDNMEKLARAVDQPAFGFLLHLGRCSDIDPDECDRRLAPWAFHAHVDLKTSQSRLDSALRILSQSGYGGYLSVEYSPPANPYAEIDAMISQVRLAIVRMQDNRHATTRSANPLIPPGVQ